jgi:ribosomal protein S18 acetylase RimI-like enzyme
MNNSNFILRPYKGVSDNSALSAIAHEATGEPYSPEKVAYELNVPGLNHLRDTIVCELSDGRIVGYACIWIDDVKDIRQGRLRYFRIAAQSPEPSLLAREVLLWAARRMQEELDSTDRPVAIIELVKEADMVRREFLEDAGFQPIRYYQIMRLKDPAALHEIPLPEGHHYIHGPGHEGAPEYVAMFNDTWIDHYGFIPLTVEEFIHDIDDDPDYNSTLDIVVKHSDGKFVGFAFCRLEQMDATLGEVMAIGIRRGFRGTGLGRVLLTHAVRTLVEHGATEIELSVDSENPSGAGRLYESVGFRAISVSRRYQLSQDGVIRLATLDAC